MRGLREYLVSFGLLLALWALTAPTANSQSGVKLTGAVRDQVGAAVPDALITLFSLDQAQVAKTNVDGRFEFTHLSPGTYDLETTRAGFRTKTVEDVHHVVDQLVVEIGTGSGILISAPTELSYEQRSGATNLAVNVVDPSGTPLSNATLSLAPAAGPVQKISTNNKGESQFTRLDPGKYTLRVFHEDFCSQRTSLRIARQNLAKLKIELVPIGPCPGEPMPTFAAPIPTQLSVE